MAARSAMGPGGPGGRGPGGMGDPNRSYNDPSNNWGSDPRDFFRKPGGSVKNRKALQLCGQVRDALNLIFSSCGDELLQSLRARMGVRCELE